MCCLFQDKSIIDIISDPDGTSVMYSSNSTIVFACDVTTLTVVDCQQYPRDDRLQFSSNNCIKYTIIVVGKFAFCAIFSAGYDTACCSVMCCCHCLLLLF